MPANSGTSQVTGATLKLLLPDGRIAIARCVANMGGTVFGFIGAMTGDDHLNDPRNCGVPPSGQAIQAEFNGQVIKLSWHLPSIDGTGRKTGETYYLIGVLNPTGSSSAGANISQPAQSVASESGPAPNPNPTPIQAQAPLPADSMSVSQLQQVDAHPQGVSISAGDAVGLLLEKTAPLYPPIAKAAGVSGAVVLQATISKTGLIEDLHIIGGPAMLWQAALDAVKTWHYRPYLVDGEPVEVETTVNVIFTLGG
jgi:TonB family protein